VSDAKKIPSKNNAVDLEPIEVRAKFLRDNAGPKAHYRIAAIALALSDANLSDGAARVFCLRLIYADRETGKNCTVSKDTLAALIGKEERQVRRLDAELIEQGYATAQRRRHTSSVFTMMASDKTRRVIAEVTRIIAAGEKPEASRTVKNDRLESFKTDKNDPCEFVSTVIFDTQDRSEMSGNPNSLTLITAEASLRSASAAAKAPAEPVIVDFQEVRKNAVAPANCSAVKPSRARQGSLGLDAPKVTPLDRYGESTENRERVYVLMRDALALWGNGCTQNPHRDRLIDDWLRKDGLDGIQAFFAALKGSEWAKVSAMEVTATRILTDAEWRARIMDGDYRDIRIRKPQSVPAVAHASQAVPVQPERFPADSKMQVAEFLYVTGEDANSIIDELNASFGAGKATRSMVRKTIVAAGANKELFRDQYWKPRKPSVAEVLAWVKTMVGWEIAYATHGTPEQLVGGKVAESCRAGAVGSAFFDALKQQYPNAWTTKNIIDPSTIIDRYSPGRWFSTGNAAFRDEFKTLASAITPEQYGPESQRLIEDSLTEWARTLHEKVGAAIAKAEADAEAAIAKAEIEAEAEERRRLEQIELWQRAGTGLYWEGGILRATSEFSRFLSENAGKGASIFDAITNAALMFRSSQNTEGAKQRILADLGIRVTFNGATAPA
jgi:hypothetical protein